MNTLGPLVDLLRITRMGRMPFLLFRSVRILPCPLRHAAVIEYFWVVGLN